MYTDLSDRGFQPKLNIMDNTSISKTISLVELEGPRWEISCAPFPPQTHCLRVIYPRMITFGHGLYMQTDSLAPHI